MKVLKGRLKKLAAVLAASMVAVVGLASSASAAPIDFSTSSGIDVAPTDVIETGFSFAAMFDTWTMLILGLIFAPVGIGFLIWLFRKLPRLGGGKS